MKTVLTLAAAAALTFVAADADAQTRRRARAPAAQPAPPLPPTPYRLVGPGAAGAEAPAQATPAAEPAAQAQPAEGPPAEGATPAAPATPATPATPASPATGVAGAQATRATPATAATPATPSAGAAGQAQGGAPAEAGAASPERARAEIALRRVLGELAAGTPNYSLMNEETAGRVRTQQPSLTPALKQYGAITAITALAPSGGSQRFRVTFANGEATFVIATDAEAKIIALGVE